MCSGLRKVLSESVKFDFFSATSMERETRKVEWTKTVQFSSWSDRFYISLLLKHIVAKYHFDTPYMIEWIALLVSYTYMYVIRFYRYFSFFFSYFSVVTVCHAEHVHLRYTCGLFSETWFFFLFCFSSLPCLHFRLEAKRGLWMAVPAPLRALMNG